jgi:2-polyprenyl-3-methyl-5-hydroxy-6-metoxy-1,4-benzoquinol methylase
LVKLENYAKDDELLRCDSCGFILEFKEGVWDARINVDYPLDFSRQWRLWEQGKFGDTTMLYGNTPEDDYAHLVQHLSLDRSSLAKMKILEVGFGHGGILQRLQADCPTAYGIDLVKPPSTAKLREKSIVMGSLFNIPFEPSQFDLVICRGVVHHTQDTRKAFFAVADQVAKEGMLYVYVYEKRSPKGLFLRNLVPFCWLYPERVRIALARLIGSLVGLTVALVKRKHKLSRDIRIYRGNYSLSAFDIISPRMTSRHSPSEVVSWFEARGFSVERIRPCFYLGIRKQIN